MMVVAGRNRTLTLLLATLLGLVVALWLFGIVAGRLAHAQEQIHEYGGTVWIGDTCHVDSGGALWCTTSG